MSPPPKRYERPSSVSCGIRCTPRHTTGLHSRCKAIGVKTRQTTSALGSAHRHVTRPNNVPPSTGPPARSNRQTRRRLQEEAKPSRSFAPTRSVIRPPKLAEPARRGVPARPRAFRAESSTLGPLHRLSRRRASAPTKKEEPLGRLRRGRSVALLPVAL